MVRRHSAGSLGVVLVAAGVFGCAGPRGAAEGAAAEGAATGQARADETEATQVRARPADDLIDREILFGNPERTSVKLSPDGRFMSWLAPVDGVLNVWLAPAGDPAAAKAITRDAKRGIRNHAWAYDARHVLYLQDEAGNEDWHLHAVDVETGSDRDLTPQQGVQARIANMSPKMPGHVAVALNDRDRTAHDVYLYDLASGERRVLARNEQGFLAIVLDEDLKPRIAIQPRPDGGLNLLRSAGGTDAPSWQPFTEVSPEDSLGTSPLNFDARGDTLYMADSRGRDTSALTAIDMGTGEQQVLAASPHADLDDVVRHPVTAQPQAAAFNHLRKDWKVLDPALEDDFETLRRVADGDPEIVSRTLDDQHWIVAYLMDTGPVRYYRYDRTSGKAAFLFTNQPQLEGLDLAPMHPVVIPARDGLELVSYLTLPRAADPDGDGRPEQASPMVLFVHGGPWARDQWGYHSYHQWLANRGYAVLSVNFRGSTGFGKQFTNAGNLEWGEKMHDDLLDAVEWAIGQGVTGPESVAIMGGSYGGYATLAGLTFTPERFACGVDIVGPSNLQTLLESIPPYWKPMLEMFATRVGDPRTEEGRALLQERSPLTRADAIVRPLLIGQGANDPRVKQAESDQIVAAMQRNDIPVTYVLYPDEGHGFARPENRLSFNAVAEAFLAECLGGARQPVDDDFRGSSIRIVTGADRVPGLAGALEGAQP